MNNPVKLALAEGRHAFGTMAFEFFVPGLCAMAAASGASFVLFDMEHSGAGIGMVKSQCAYARGTGVVPMVRVPETRYPAIASVMDAGARGVMAPMVESAEQAALLVACTRYPPAGLRGAAFGVAHDDYRGGDVAAKVAAADRNTLVIAMVETARGVEHVDAIAATDGVDVIWLGHFDLTNSLGIPGQFAHPAYLSAVDAIAAAAARHGKALGMMAADDVWARDYLRRGFRMISYGLDHLLFQRALSDGIAKMVAATEA